MARETLAETSLFMLCFITGIKERVNLSDGMFGNLWVDQEKLNDFKLEAHKDDKKVLSRKADRDLINLLTKRDNAKKPYGPQPRPSRS